MRALNDSQQESKKHHMNDLIHTKSKNSLSDHDYDYCDVPIRHVPIRFVPPVMNKAYAPTSIHVEENQAYTSTMKKRDLSMQTTHNNIGPAAYSYTPYTCYNRESSENERSNPRTDDDDGDYEMMTGSQPM